MPQQVRFDSESAMADVTETMLAYRECARLVWNGTLRAVAEPYVDFETVEAFAVIREVLFRQLVLRPLGQVAFTRVNRSEPYPFLRLRPSVDPLPVMVNRPSDDGNVYWDAPEARLRAAGLSLAFVDHHDWDQFGYIDLQNYRVRIEACDEHPHLVGRAALVDVHHAAVEYTGPERPAPEVREPDPGPRRGP